MLKESFPFDWIKPGEFRYCGKCGITLIEKSYICASCKYKPTMDDFICDFCPDRAVIMFVHGYRCQKHQFQVEPSSATITEKLIVTSGKIKKLSEEEKKKRKKEIQYCKEIHSELFEQRERLAKERKEQGLKPLFWMEK